MSKSAATSWLTELETPPNQTRLDFYFLRAELYPFLGIYLFLKQSDFGQVKYLKHFCKNISQYRDRKQTLVHIIIF